MAAAAVAAAQRAGLVGGKEARYMEDELPYGNIIALNDNAAVLHYYHHDRNILDKKERHSFLIDAGARRALWRKRGEKSRVDLLTPPSASPAPAGATAATTARRRQDRSAPVHQGGQEPVVGQRGGELLLQTDQRVGGDDVADGPLRCSLDWHRTEGEEWTIAIRTADGIELRLEDGGSRLLLDGAEQPTERTGEYPDIYARFVDLIDERRSQVDVAPLRLVADCLLVGRRRTVEPVSG